MIILLADSFFLICILYIYMQSVYHAATCKMSNSTGKNEPLLFAGIHIYPVPSIKPIFKFKDTKRLPFLTITAKKGP